MKEDNRVLFVTPSQESPVFGIKTGLRRVLSRRGMCLQVVYTPFERRISSIKVLADVWHPAGVVVTTSDFDVRDLGIPVVFAAVEHKGGRHCVVGNDSSAMGHLAAGELMRLGNRSYGYVAHPWDFNWVRLRCIAFRKALGGRAAVHAFRPRSLRMDDRDMVGEFKKFISRLEKPCGIFAANDEIAALTISVACELGFSVPEDVAVVGVDDNPAYVECGQASITSVVPDWEGIGWASGECLLRRLDGDDTKAVRRVVAPKGIVRRASTRRLMRIGNTLARKAMEYIRDNACSGITSSDVIAHIGCSQSLANLRFREATGKSILQAIHDERFAKAQDLVSTGQTDISQVASLCGYRSTSFFRKEYKKRTGHTFGACSSKQGTFTNPERIARR